LVLVYLIGNRIFKKRLGLLAALFYAVAVMPIQQSHFFTTDTYETFFILLTFLLLIYFIKTKSTLTSSIIGVFIGVSMGLALSSKISSVVFGGIIALALGMKFLKQYELMNLKKMFSISLIIHLFSVLSYMLFSG
jgi:4-amino-4-deoxy-L-arabinose transferase-like glycosyltransferase